MIVKTALSIFLLCVAASHSLAAQITSGFISRHSEAPAPSTGLTAWREVHPGVGYKWDSGFMVTGFLNSEDRPALLGVYEEEIIRRPAGPASAGARAGVGAALGYREMRIAPVAYPSAFLSVGPVELVLGHNIGAGKRVPSVTWLQARVQLK